MYALTESICDAMLFSESNVGKRNYKYRISLKPTKEIEKIIKSISKNDLPDGSVSKFFRRLFTRYSKKPLGQREQIIFSETYAFLQDACKTHRNLDLITTTTPEKIHHVIPYCVMTSQEEMFNYLLCEEIVSETISKATTYRLNRLSWVKPRSSNEVLKEHVIINLERMRAISPLYPINDDEEICVAMTERGETLYKRIYYGRPRYSRLVTEGLKKLYYFNCSVAQAALYFRRFEQDTIEVIAPIALKKNLHDFFKRAVIPLALFNDFQYSESSSPYQEVESSIKP